MSFQAFVVDFKLNRENLRGDCGSPWTFTHLNLRLKSIVVASSVSLNRNLAIDFAHAQVHPQHSSDHWWAGLASLLSPIHRCRQQRGSAWKHITLKNALMEKSHWKSHRLYRLWIEQQTFQLRGGPAITGLLMACDRSNLHVGQSACGRDEDSLCFTVKQTSASASRVCVILCAVSMYLACVFCACVGTLQY